MLVALPFFTDSLFAVSNEPPNATLAQALSSIIDPSRTGYVSHVRFAELLRAFGPLTTCLRTLRSVYTLPSFAGSLSSHEAELLLLGSVARCCNLVFYFRFN
jgi:hypothetical protein